jgi:hypothetical protein
MIEQHASTELWTPCYATGASGQPGTAGSAAMDVANTQNDPHSLVGLGNLAEIRMFLPMEVRSD